MKKKIYFLIILTFFTTLFVCLLNVEVTTKQGINGVVRTKKIPLYYKALAFMYRHFAYKQLVNEIIEDKQIDQDKVLAIFNWTHQNIKTNIPEGWPIVDDHILNIIIRGYGVHDQLADVFTALCVYAGIPATIYIISPPGVRNKLAVAAVYLDGAWRIFDPFHDKYFRNKKGEIASIQDIISNPSLVDREQNSFIYKGNQYFRYFEKLPAFSEPEILRAQQQMPLQRIAYEIKKALSIGKQPCLE